LTIHLPILKEIPVREGKEIPSPKYTGRERRKTLYVNTR
jgi:hypothetical protein